MCEYFFYNLIGNSHYGDDNCPGPCKNDFYCPQFQSRSDPDLQTPGCYVAYAISFHRRMGKFKGFYAVFLRIGNKHPSYILLHPDLFKLFEILKNVR